MNCGPDDLCAPPDVCAHAEESKQQHLISHATYDSDNAFQRFVKRDRPLLIAIILMIVFMNLPRLKYIVYPFMIFSTWVHEMCHGLMAILVGGGIAELFIYEDGSGLAWTWTTGESYKRAFVASAGYTGTALLGGILLLFRRTRRGPTVGLIAIACCILLSCALYVRNTFGIVALSIMGVVFLLFAWKLKTAWIAYLYSFLAATCSFNAVDSIHDLFASTQGYVNGEAMSSDAHTVAELWGMTNVFWATCWLIFALVMSVIGLVFVFDGITYKKEQRKIKEEQQASIHTAPVTQTFNGVPVTIV